MRPPAAALLGLLLATLLLAQGCGRACTLIGSFNGVVVIVPRAVYSGPGSARIRLCDHAGCAAVTRRLAPPYHPAAPKQYLQASFHALGRRFDAGPAEITVTVRRPDGHIAARHHGRLRLRHDYPNGKACDGSGWVNGGVTMRLSDRTAS